MRTLISLLIGTMIGTIIVNVGQRHDISILSQRIDRQEEITKNHMYRIQELEKQVYELAPYPLNK